MDTHYVIILDKTIDDEDSIEVLAVKHTFEEAKQAFDTLKTETFAKLASDLGYDEIEEDETAWSAYYYGFYSQDHLTLSIHIVK